MKILYSHNLGDGMQNMNNIYEVLTISGFQKFDGIKKSKRSDGLELLLSNNTKFKCTEEHLLYVGRSKCGKIFRQASKIKPNNKIQNLKLISSSKTSGEFFDLVNVSGGNNYITSSVTSHNCAFTPTRNWTEFSDSIFPSQGALSWRKNILLSTANGKNHFYHIVDGARRDKNGFTIHEVNWVDVPRYNIDGSLKSPEVFKDEIVSKYGELYFAQNYSNDFLGSSNTMIDSTILNKFSSPEVLERLQPGLKIYEQPIPGHKYILTVDASKDGDDFFGVQVVDTDNMNFRQVAAARLQVEYLLMPEYIYNWATYFNGAFVIIENNEGAGQSIADTLKTTYEYNNLYYDLTKDSKIKNLTKLKKSYPGFRTNVKTRKQILSLLKIFLESGNLELLDKETIDEFDTFILINGKYQAEDGYHDDMVMSLALVFAPFINTKNILDMKALINTLFKSDEEVQEAQKVQISEILGGCRFDDGTDIQSSGGLEDYDSMFIRHSGGFF